MKKLLLKTLILGLVFVLVTAVTVTAATVSEPTVTPDKSDRSVSVSGKVTGAEEEQQVVILVIKSTANLSSLSDSDIAYIDQVPAKEDGSYSFEFGIDESKGNAFSVYVGGTSCSSPASASFSFGGGPGDIDGNNKVNFDDYMIVINAFGTVKGDEKYDDRADIKNGDEKINFDDYMVIINNFGNVY